MYFEDIFKKFQDARLRYILAGGLAINAYGVPRMTYDVDILVDLTPANVILLFTVLAELKFRPKVPITGEDFADENKRKMFMEKKGMRVLSFWQDGAPIREIDVFVDNPIDFEELWEKRVSMPFTNGIEVNVVNIDHLIKLKQIAHRMQDVADIESLKKVKKVSDEKE